MDSANLNMTQGETDGYVALHCHASQVQRGIFSGEESKQHKDAADGDIEFVDGVADDEQDGSQHHLDHVIDHQVNKEDISGILVENLERYRKTMLENNSV